MPLGRQRLLLELAALGRGLAPLGLAALLRQRHAALALELLQLALVPRLVRVRLRLGLGLGLGLG